MLTMQRTFFLIMRKVSYQRVRLSMLESKKKMHKKVLFSIDKVRALCYIDFCKIQHGYLKRGFMGNDYIPARGSDFDGWFDNVTVYIIAKCTGQPPVWPHIPQSVQTELTDRQAAWHSAYTKCFGPHTSVDIADKNSKHVAAIAFIRPFVNQYLRFAPVTDEDRIAMGIHNRDNVHTSIPTPMVQVEADIIFPGIHLIGLKKIRPVAGSTIDNRSDYGVRIYYGIMSEASAKDRFRLSSPPESGFDLPHSVFTRKSKYFFDFDGDSGKTIYFCLRYENGKGEAGPFGPLISAVIP
jgi:hypothetical protein